jgi:hypothetical protein
MSTPYEARIHAEIGRGLAVVKAAHVDIPALRRDYPEIRMAHLRGLGEGAGLERARQVRVTTCVQRAIGAAEGR